MLSVHPLNFTKKAGILAARWVGAKARKFYDTWNYVRLHGLIAQLSPMLFWECWNQDLIERFETAKEEGTLQTHKPLPTIIGTKGLEGVLCQQSK